MKVENLKMYPFQTTLMGVIKGVLDYFETGTTAAMAFGGSGHAFLINVHNELCPSGPYCWKYDGFYPLVRNLGLEMTDLGFYHKGTSAHDREAIETRVKDFLDNYQPCSLLNMENQIIYGYDDKGFLAAEPWQCPVDVAPARLTFGSWKELGDEVHVNFFVFRKVNRKDDATIVRDSLRYALELFRHPENHRSDLRYGIGFAAYDNWARAAARHGGEHGNWWNAEVWSECRQMASAYFAEIGARSEGEPARLAGTLSAAYKEISGLLKQLGNKALPADDKVRIAGQLKAKEQAALASIEALLQALGQPAEQPHVEPVRPGRRRAR